ncbi:MAG: GTPase Era [Oscillospiraceae bacterium]|nr:GTPase Era [Oscillospiraceae bacterium]
MIEIPETKSGFIAIIGRPNVGKSSILNAMIGEKIAIVSDKPQTTRTRITGVLTREETQLVFLDTPGMHTPKHKLSEHMVETVKDSVADVDLALLVVTPEKEPSKAEISLCQELKAGRIPAILVINKIDLIENKELLIPVAEKYSRLYDFAEVLFVSALEHDGVDYLLDLLCKYAQPSPHFFPDDTLTDQPERVIAAEIIREKLLRSMRDEIPHGIAVVIESMKEREDGRLVDIHAAIYCERESHKGMIIGKSGALLRKIGSEARIEIEGFLGMKINLQLWVKVKPDWRNREALIRSFGLE